MFGKTKKIRKIFFSKLIIFIISLQIVSAGSDNTVTLKRSLNYPFSGYSNLGCFIARSNSNTVVTILVSESVDHSHMLGIGFDGASPSSNIAEKITGSTSCFSCANLVFLSTSGGTFRQIDTSNFGISYFNKPEGITSIAALSGGKYSSNTGLSVVADSNLIVEYLLTDKPAGAFDNWPSSTAFLAKFLSGEDITSIKQIVGGMEFQTLRFVAVLLEKDGDEYVCSYSYSAAGKTNNPLNAHRCQAFENIVKIDEGSDQTVYILHGNGFKHTVWDAIHGNILEQITVATKALDAIISEGTLDSVFYIQDQSGTTEAGYIKIFNDQVKFMMPDPDLTTVNPKICSSSDSKRFGIIGFSKSQPGKVGVHLFEAETSPANCALCNTLQGSNNCYHCDPTFAIKNIVSGMGDCGSGNYCATDEFMHDGICVETRCHQGFGHANADNICERCQNSKCMECFADKATCEKCSQGFYSLPNCVLQCDSSCRECQTNPGTCTSCHPGKFLDGSSCADSCPLGTYADQTTNKCETCDGVCSSCEGSADNCLLCSDSSKFADEGTCVDVCPDDKVGHSGVCSPCDHASEYYVNFQNCLKCSYNDTSKLIDCPVKREFNFEENFQNFTRNSKNLAIVIRPSLTNLLKEEEIKEIKFENIFKIEGVNEGGSKNLIKTAETQFEEGDTGTKVTFVFDSTISFDETVELSIKTSNETLILFSEADGKFAFIEEKSLLIKVVDGPKETEENVIEKYFVKKNSYAIYTFNTPLINPVEDYEIQIRDSKLSEVNFETKKIYLIEESDNRTLRVDLEIYSSLTDAKIILKNKNFKNSAVTIENVNYLQTSTSKFFSNSKIASTTAFKVTAGITVVSSPVTLQGQLKLFQMYELIRLADVEKSNTFDNFLDIFSDNVLDVIPNVFESNEVNFVEGQKSVDDTNYCRGMSKRIMMNEYECFILNSQGNIVFQFLIFLGLFLILSFLMMTCRIPKKEDFWKGQKDTSLKKLIFLSWNIFDWEFWIKFTQAVQLEIILSSAINIKYTVPESFFEIFNYILSFVFLFYYLILIIKGFKYASLLKNYNESLDKKNLEKIGKKEKESQNEAKKFYGGVKSDLKVNSKKEFGFFIHELEMIKNFLIPLIMIFFIDSPYFQILISFLIFGISIVFNLYFRPLESIQESLFTVASDFSNFLMLGILFLMDIIKVGNDARENFWSFLMIFVCLIPIVIATGNGIYDTVMLIKKKCTKKNQIEEEKDQKKQYF